MSKARIITYRKVTRDRFIQLLERIGYSVTLQSSDGTYMLIRYPDGEPTDYWLFRDSLEHKLPDNRGGTTFMLSECKLLLDDNQNTNTVALVDKYTKNNSIFVQFHNFDTHKKRAEEAL